MNNNETILKAYRAILADQKLSKSALKNIGQALVDQGVNIESVDTVDGVEVFNKHIYELYPGLRGALVAASQGNPPAIDCASFGCVLCMTGIMASAGAAIGACVAVGGGGTCVTAIAALVGITGSAMRHVMDNCHTNIGCVVRGICEALDACSS